MLVISSLFLRRFSDGKAFPSAKDVCFGNCRFGGASVEGTGIPFFVIVVESALARLFVS